MVSSSSLSPTAPAESAASQAPAVPVAPNAPVLPLPAAPVPAGTTATTPDARVEPAVPDTAPTTAATAPAAPTTPAAPAASIGSGTRAGDGAAGRFPAGPAADPAGSRGEHRVRSFHARRGRITVAQAAAIERHWARWGVELDGSPLDLGALFGSPEMPVVLEIGFGMGDATARMAADDPATGILAVDVHTPGQGNLLMLAERGGLTNLRIANGDAIVLLRDMLTPASLAGLRVYFPDPWPKARHVKRRLIQPSFTDLVTPLLRPGAVVHCATDWEPYAEQMLDVLSAAPGLENQYGPGAGDGSGYAPRPAFRPMTKFERQGLEKGHVVRDLLFTRV